MILKEVQNINKINRRHASIVMS